MSLYHEGGGHTLGPITSCNSQCRKDRQLFLPSSMYIAMDAAALTYQHRTHNTDLPAPHTQH